MALTQPAQSETVRRWVLDVNTGTLATEVWTLVNGINECTVNPFEANMEEDDVFRASGYGSTTKTGLRATVELKIIRQKSVPAATFDVGQEKLRTHALTLGSGGVAAFRVYDRDGGTEAYQGFAEVAWVPDGGKMTDLETVKVTLHCKDALDVIVNPNAGS